MYTRLTINFPHICALTYLYCVGPKIFSSEKLAEILSNEGKRWFLGFLKYLAQIMT